MFNPVKFLTIGAAVSPLAWASPIAVPAPPAAAEAVAVPVPEVEAPSTDVLGMASRAPAAVAVKGRACGTAPPTDALLAQHAFFHANKGHSMRRRSSINVQVHFHIVETNAQAGSITPTMVANQFSVMQKSYAPAGISFSLASVDYTINNTWAADGDDSQMKSALRKGGYDELNIYFQTALSADGSGASNEQLLGFCTLPTNVTYKPCSTCAPVEFPAADWAGDGCNVHAGSMPGGWLTGYNLGKTAVHETGHWFGLLHVFQDYTCAAGDPGDYIADTPQQSTSTQGCPANKNSCPNCPGNDAIHNYMDYSSDACYTGFSTDQISRMQNMWMTLRKGM